LTLENHNNDDKFPILVEKIRIEIEECITNCILEKFTNIIKKSEIKFLSLQKSKNKVTSLIRISNPDGIDKIVTDCNFIQHVQNKLRNIQNFERNVVVTKNKNSKLRCFHVVYKLVL